MRIRRYQSGDRPQLIKLWAAAFPNPAPHNAPDVMLDAKLATDDLIFIAEENGAVCGAAMAGYDGHRGWIYAVAVAPDMRRRGIGRGLVEASTHALHGVGCNKLNLQVRADNSEVVAFYESLGFVREPRISLGKLL